MHYVAVIDKDPDSAYGIRFPEVPVKKAPVGA